MRKKLTQKTCLMLTALSLAVCLLAYGCIWFFLPNAGQGRARRELERRTQQLVSRLRLTQKAQSEELFTAFIRETGAQLSLQNNKGQAVSLFPFEKQEDGVAQEDGRQIRQPFQFADTNEEYLLCVHDLPARAQQMRRAVKNSLPFVA